METIVSKAYAVVVTEAPVHIYAVLPQGSRQLLAECTTTGQHIFIAQSATTDFEGGSIGLVTGPFENSRVAMSGAGKAGTAPGESAFDTWKRVNNRPDATEADFIDSLKGEEGPQGVPGPAGEEGKSPYYDSVSGHWKFWQDGEWKDGPAAGGGTPEFNWADGDPIVLGYKASAGENSLAIGNWAIAQNAKQSIAIGRGAFVEEGATSSIAIGQSTSCSASDAICIGSGQAVRESVAIGARVYSNFSNSVAIGYSAINDGNYSVAIGCYSVARNNDCISIGCNSYVSGLQSVALGSSINAPYDSCIAIGYLATPKGENSIVVGHNAGAQAYSVSIGSSAHAVHRSVSLGGGSYSELNGVAIGRNAKAFGGSFAIGANSLAPFRGVGVMTVANGCATKQDTYDPRASEMGWQFNGNPTYVTQLYLIGCNTPLAARVTGGEPGIGYTVWIKGQGFVYGGCIPLSSLCIEHENDFASIIKEMGDANVQAISLALEQEKAIGQVPETLDNNKEK